MTHLKKSKEQLIDDNKNFKNYQDRFIHIIENAKDMIYRMSLPGGKYEYVSPACKEIFGYESKVFIDTPILIQKAIHPDFAQYFQNEWQKLLDGNLSPTYEYKIINKSGEERWLNQRNVLIKDKRGKAVAIEGVVTDITERKQAELERNDLLRDLRERAKELNCLYKISDYSYENITIEKFIKKVIKIIPQSFQYSDYCSVKIIINSGKYQSEKYRKTKWEIKHDIVVNNEKIGEVEINYLKELPEHYQGPFLKEELELINGIAELISRTVDYKLKELELKEKNEEYLSINEELKEKNEEYLALNEELIEKNEEYQTLYEEYEAQNEELHEHNEEFQAINEELEEEMERRREAQGKLQQQHDAYMTIFDNHPDVLYVADTDTYEVLFVNKTFQKILGENPIGEKCYEKFQGFNKPCNFCSNDILKKNNGKPYVWEYHNPKLNADFHITDQLIDWPDGRKVRFEMATDVTERKQAENKIKESEAQFRSVFENSPVGKSMTGTDGSLRVNKAFCDILGYSEKEIQNKNWKEITHPDDIQESENIVHSLLKGEKETAHYEKRYIHKKGKIVYTEVNTTLLRDENNNPKFFITSISDVTERKKAEIKLKESKERLTLALEGTYDGLWDWNLITNEIFFSKPWKKIIGYKDKEIINSYESWERLVHPDDIEQAVKAIDDYIKGKIKNYEVEFRMKHKKGHWVNILSRGKVKINKDGIKERFVGTHIDVTELRKVQKELQEEKDLIERYFSLVEALIIVLDQKGSITKINRKACELLGYSEQELTGKNWFQKCLSQPEGNEVVFPMFKQIISGSTEGTDYFENKIITKNKEEFDIAWHNNYMRDSKGNINGVISVGEDITEKRKYQDKLENTLKELERSNKDLEQFAYVASHDLQEPLRKVKNFAELFAKKYSGALDEKADQYINYMTSGADRMQILILDLLSYSRVATRGKEFKKTDINNVVKDAIENLQFTIEENNAEIIFDKLPVIKADDAQMSQLFQNLISNAIKFRSKEDPIIKINAFDKNNQWHFEVSDNGIGLEMKYANRIFEVFQRLHTKEEYKGTGIGLAICKKIIERRNGKIWVKSELGKGTTFYFTIPKIKQ